jgi:hypothetical protein
MVRRGGANVPTKGCFDPDRFGFRGCVRAAPQRRFRTKPSHETPNPILNIDYQTAKKWSYIRLSDLLKMKRATVNVSDLKTNIGNQNEGVSLGQLVPNSSGYQIEVFRDSFAFKDKLAVSSANLDMQSALIVADTINGKSLGKDHQFCFIAKNSHGDPVVIKEFSYIKVISAQ